MSQELPIIDSAPKPVTQADVKLDPISASRAEIDEVFRNDNLVNLAAVREQLRPEKTVATESQTVLAISNKVVELRGEKTRNTFFTEVDRRGTFVHSIGRFLGFEVSPRLESLTEEHLIKDESRLGATIFGPLEDGELHREFFFTDAKNAYFYKKIRDDSGAEQELTLHYEVLPQGILKISSRPGIPNHILAGHELDNFVAATKAYFHKVSDMYNSDQPITTKAA